MANFSATIPVEQADAVNKALETQGFGPGNFSVPVAENEGEAAKHAGLHCWHNPEFQGALVSLQATYPTLVITEAADGKPNMEGHCTARGWSAAQDVEKWFEASVMKGDTRLHDAKTWESLLDYNVWAPPIGWREVVVVGYPAWVQPTGAHDAYKMGDRVRFEGKDWESRINANVWSPTGYPAGWKAI